MAGPPPPPPRAGLKTCADFEKVWRPLEGRVYCASLLLFGLRAAAATDAVLWRLREMAFREAAFLLLRGLKQRWNVEAVDSVGSQRSVVLSLSSTAGSTGQP